MEYSRSSYLSLPSKSGVYVFSDKTGLILYVGKAKDLKSRVSSYFVNTSLLGEKTKVLVSQIEKIKITIVESELEALLLEAFYIKKYNPKYNIRLTDNKSYIRIRITVKDTYPRVLLARREDDDNSVYFGPYPSSSAVKLVLKTIRKVFPFQSVPNHPKRICLYNHLGLCPCPPVFDSPELQKEYRKNIRGIIRILEGESKKIMKELEKERDILSKKEMYEEALKIQKKIDALSLITTPFHRPFEYDVNPNLRTDIRKQELDELMAVLNKTGEFHLEKLERIECYDNSNIQGTNATSSMVVLTNGEIDKSQYRRFKIRREWEKKSSKSVILSSSEGSQKVDFSPAKQVQNDKRRELPNDFEMMKEVLRRRLSHDEWNMPDLIIVDGGKGQVSSALQSLASMGSTIPLIGLAKREETIVVPTSGDKNFIEISLPKNSKALHVIMRIRDEAHRFAITYHRKLRSQSAFII